MEKQRNLTLGSLFDGIGGFPYAGSFFGIKSLWASEILPGAISVTRRHMPEMEHVGDITQLHGGKLPPVDIITFGSPCQGLSAAGKRKGFSDPRSGLFSEAIRIINEMREATNGQYPTWAIWENVPGALSSNRGLDYKAVLEAFAGSEVPFPRSGRWANAGMVRSRGADLAWCVYNAQHFGTAQRRRRIFLVCDFGGKRASEILFIPKSLRGYFAAGGTPRQGASAYASRGSDSPMPDAGARNCLTPWDVQSRRIHEGNGQWPALYGGEGGGHGYVASETDKGDHTVNCLTPWDTQQSRIFTDNGKSPTLAGADGGGGRNPAGLVFAAFMGDSSPSSYGIEYSEEASPTLKPRLSGTPCLCEPKLARTLTARGDSSPCADRGQNIVAVPAPDILCAATGQPNAEMLENLSATLTCYHEQPIICGTVGVHQNQSGDIHTADIAYSLATNGNATGRNAPLVAHPVLCAATAQANAEIGEELCPTITEAAGKSGNNKPYIVHPDVSGTLCASGAGLSRPAGMASETDLCVAVAVDCRNFRERPELSGTLQAKENGSYSLNYQNPVRMGYIVRRLTPTECERLQGYPDGWTAFGHDGKPISDTARYMMLGNSIAVPCVAYILMGIALAHRKEVFR